MGGGDGDNDDGGMHTPMDGGDDAAPRVPGALRWAGVAVQRYDLRGAPAWGTSAPLVCGALLAPGGRPDGGVVNASRLTVTVAGGALLCGGGDGEGWWGVARSAPEPLHARAARLAAAALDGALVLERVRGLLETALAAAGVSGLSEAGGGLQWERFAAAALKATAAAASDAAYPFSRAPRVRPGAPPPPREMLLSAMLAAAVCVCAHRA